MNCPNLPPDDPRSHSQLLDRSLFRIALPWPPQRADGTRIDPEFSIEVVRDRGGGNTDPRYGPNSPNPTISVYRRPHLQIAAPLSAAHHGVRAAGVRRVDRAPRCRQPGLSNGQLMSEEVEIGKRRAEQLAALLQGANLKSPSYRVTWRDESATATGVDDYAMRHDHRPRGGEVGARSTNSTRIASGSIANTNRPNARWIGFAPTLRNRYPACFVRSISASRPLTSS